MAQPSPGWFARVLIFEFFPEIGRQFGNLHADLVHGVPVPDGDGLIFQGIKVKGHAIGGAGLVMAAVPFADAAHHIEIDVQSQLLHQQGKHLLGLVSQFFCSGRTAILTGASWL